MDNLPIPWQAPPYNQSIEKNGIYDILNAMEVSSNILQSIHKLPKKPGVYLFKDRSATVYIGKAINLQERVKNHFFQSTYKDALFIEKITHINHLETESEIEALILEARLIKKYQPKFNQVWRDDKNYFYVALAKNNQGVPYVFVTHQPTMTPNTRHAAPGAKRKSRRATQYIGPFTEGRALKKTLAFLRKVFPYYTGAGHPEKKCPWCHLELCPGNNPNIKEYKKNINKLILLLQGRRKTVLHSLKQEMAHFSKQNKFEEALTVRDKMLALKQVMAHAHVIGNTKSVSTQNPAGNNSLNVNAQEAWIKTQTILQELLDIKQPILKIECYDISNIQGQQAVGSMVVFSYGKPDKSQYKKFRIRMENKPNDIAMLKEILQRRLAHPEWPYPQVILIDGGIAQLNIGIKTKKEKPETQHIKVISIAKRFKELYIEGKKKPLLLASLPQQIYNLIIHLDDEAHRFAITYHKKLRKNSLLHG